MTLQIPTICDKNNDFRNIFLESVRHSRMLGGIDKCLETASNCLLLAIWTYHQNHGTIKVQRRFIKRLLNDSSNPNIL